MSAPVRSNSASASGPVAATDDLEALLAEHVGERVAVALLVLDDEHSGHGRASCGRCPRRVVVGTARRGRRRPARQGQGEGRALALDGPDPDLAAVGGGDVLDDRQPEAGAAGGAVPGRVDAVEALEDPVDLAGRDADALVGHRDVDHRRRRPGRRPPPSAVLGRSRRPRWRPGCRAPAATCVRVAEDLQARARRRGRPRCSWPAASIALWSIDRGRPRRRRRPAAGSSSGSSPCSRDSSMICCTSRVSRSLSVCIRPANRVTASGSSAASCTASASSLIAPTGVFSSWDTLATKSRRIASTRRSRVRSSTSASTSRLLERRDPRGHVARRGTPVRRESPARSRGSARRGVPAGPGRRARRRPAGCRGPARSAYAGAEAFSTVVARRRRRARCCAARTSTVATPGGQRRAPRPASACVLLALADAPRQHARRRPARRRAARTASACVVGVHAIDRTQAVHRRSASEAARPALPRLFTPRSRLVGPGLVTWRAYRHRHARRLPRPARLDLRRPRRDDRHEVAGGRRPGHPGAAQRRRRDRRAGHLRRRRDRRAPASGSRTRPSSCSPCSSRSPATCGCWSPRCGWSAELERMGDLSVHVAKVARLRVPEVAVPEEMRPDDRSGWPRSPRTWSARVAGIIAERDVDGARRARAGRRGDGPAPPLARSGCCSTTPGRTASSRPSTSRCSAATTSGSPTTPSRWPAGWSTWSPARRTTVDQLSEPMPRHAWSGCHGSQRRGHRLRPRSSSS